MLLSLDAPPLIISCSRRRPLLVALSVLLVATGLTQSARAVTNLGTANAYNVFSLGNDSQSNTDAAGKIAAAGNATFSSYTACSGLGGGSAVNLAVGGTLTMTGGNIHGSTAAGTIILHDPTTSGNLNSVNSTTLDQNGTVNGNVLYGTTYTNNASSKTGVSGTVTKGTYTFPVNFGTETNNLKSLSTSCAGLTANGTTSVVSGGITLTGTASGLNIFSISGSSLASANGLTINCPSGSTVLVNISGSADSMQNFGIKIKGTTNQYVVYNFSFSTTLTLGGIAVEGSILAPFAAVNFTNGNFDGTLVCASLTGSGEGHSYPFLGTSHLRSSSQHLPAFP